MVCVVKMSNWLCHNVAMLVPPEIATINEKKRGEYGIARTNLVMAQKRDRGIKTSTGRAVGLSSVTRLVVSRLYDHPENMMTNILTLVIRILD